MEKIRVWLYCRVASRGADDVVMETQEGLLRQALHLDAHELVGITREYGPGGNIDRPTLLELQSMAQQNGLDQLWVTCQDRISRNCQLTKQWADMMAACGVTICERSSGGQMVDISPMLHQMDQVMRYMHIETQTQEQFDSEEGGSDMTEQQNENALGFH